MANSPTMPGNGQVQQLMTQEMPVAQGVGVLSDRETPVQRQEAEPKAENKTGLPDRLKEGIESMSGYDLSGVRVNYNSPKPAQVNAHAYTQGQAIEVASGQERHLPHEAWHVVQQMQGRVRPTLQVKGVGVNDDRGLEREADVMGQRAVQMGSRGRVQKRKEEGKLARKEEKPRESVVERAPKTGEEVPTTKPGAIVMQKKDLAANKLNVAGEEHSESDRRREEEKRYAKERTGGEYYLENEFATREWWLFGKDKSGDPQRLRAEMRLADLKYKVIEDYQKKYTDLETDKTKRAMDSWPEHKELLIRELSTIVIELGKSQKEEDDLAYVVKSAGTLIELNKLTGKLIRMSWYQVESELIPRLREIIREYEEKVLDEELPSGDDVSKKRSIEMNRGAEKNAARYIGRKTGVWKIGNDHIRDIQKILDGDKSEMLTREEFNDGFNKWEQERG